jgi:MoaA/NifB/PqqE/SkfB family radical SAM enzyme
MLIKLSKNTYVRTFGPYTYLLDRLNDADRIFTNAEVFMRWIGRTPVDREEVADRVCSVYVDADADEIKKDFNEFIDRLIADGLVLAGETGRELEATERFFSYDAPDPKTTAPKKILSKEEVEKTPHIVLGKYLNEHCIPLRLHVDLTQACTERCIHCYIPEYNAVFLPYEKVVSVLDEFRELGGMHVTFSGGECMLHPDFEKIVRYAQSKDLTVGILSNLTLCDDKMVSLLKEVDATVQVSLYSMDEKVHDGITKRTGSCKETKAAIERLYRANVPCFIACPTMKQNVELYYEVVEYAKTMNMSVQVDFIIMGKMNCDVSNLPCRVDLCQAKKILHDLIYEAMPVNSEYFSLAKSGDLPSKEEWASQPVCSAGVDSLCLDSTGVYYPCPGFAGFKLGNCYKDSLSWVWNESPEMLRLRAVRGRDFKKCVDCPDLNHCSVCMCRNFNETGNIFEPVDYFCQVAKLNHEILDERLKEV